MYMCDFVKFDSEALACEFADDLWTSMYNISANTIDCRVSTRLTIRQIDQVSNLEASLESLRWSVGYGLVIL